jgi:hypothetical protein
LASFTAKLSGGKKDFVWFGSVQPRSTYLLMPIASTHSFGFAWSAGPVNLIVVCAGKEASLALLATTSIALSPGIERQLLHNSVFYGMTRWRRRRNRRSDTIDAPLDAANALASVGDAGVQRYEIRRRMACLRM